MTIPRRLQEKRDELCDLYKQECLDNWHSPGLYLKPDFNKGFEQACDLLLPEIQKLLEALKFYSLKSNYSLVDEGRNYSVDYKCYELNEKTYGDDELGTKAKQALQSIEDFLGEKSEGVSIYEIK